MYNEVNVSPFHTYAIESMLTSSNTIAVQKDERDDGP